MRTGRSTYLAIFIGGFAGAVTRAELAEAVVQHAGQWPWATFAANITGAFVLGLVIARGLNVDLLGVGFCGALTTFSTMQLELLNMLDAGRVGLALAYALVSITTGYLAIGAARAFARRSP